MSSAQPRMITKSDPRQVTIAWTDGHTTVYTAPELRALCPCARCIDELSGVRTHDPRSVPHDLLTEDVRLVGNYAISIRFSDKHDTGIYSFPMLRENDPAEPGERG